MSCMRVDLRNVVHIDVYDWNRFPKVWQKKPIPRAVLNHLGTRTPGEVLEGTQLLIISDDDSTLAVRQQAKRERFKIGQLKCVDMKEIGGSKS